MRNNHTKDTNAYVSTDSIGVEQEALSSLPVECLDKLTSSLHSHKRRAQSILGTTKLHPTLLDALITRDELWAPSKEDSTTLLQLRQLLDEGILGTGTTPGFISQIPYNSTAARKIPGFFIQVSITSSVKDTLNFLTI